MYHIIDTRNDDIIAEVPSDDRLAAGAICFMLSQEARIWWGLYKIKEIDESERIYDH